MTDYKKVGWIGLGNMGAPLAMRLIEAGYEVTVWNRTAEKGAPLVKAGASQATDIRGTGTADVVFSMVSTSKDLEQVMLDPNTGLLTGSNLPKIIVDCSTVSVEASQKIREVAEKNNVKFFAAPVSGNGKVVSAGKLSVVCSGEEDTFKIIKPMIESFGRSVTYVGKGETARLVKIYHNLLLGVVTQSLV